MFRFIFRDVLTIDGATVRLSNAITLYINHQLLRYLKHCLFGLSSLFFSHIGAMPLLYKNEINSKNAIKTASTYYFTVTKLKFRGELFFASWMGCRQDNLLEEVRRAQGKQALQSFL